MEVYDRTPPSTPSEARRIISKLIEFTKNITDVVHRKVIGGITKRQAKDFAAKGINVTDKYVHSIENSAIRHNQLEHGNPDTEALRGQIAITYDDYLYIPDIIENYDTVEKSPQKSRQGLEVIIYTKTYPDGTIYYLEEIRNGRNSLAFDTMYKRKKKKGIDSSGGLVSETPPSTPIAPPDNLNSVGKDSNSSSNFQGNAEENSSDGVKFVGEYSGAVNPVPQYIKKYLGSFF